MKTAPKEDIIIKGMRHPSLDETMGAMIDPAMQPKPCESPHKLITVPRYFLGT